MELNIKNGNGGSAHRHWHGPLFIFSTKIFLNMIFTVLIIAKILFFFFFFLRNTLHKQISHFVNRADLMHAVYWTILNADVFLRHIDLWIRLKLHLQLRYVWSFYLSALFVHFIDLPSASCVFLSLAFFCSCLVLSVGLVRLPTFLTSYSCILGLQLRKKCFQAVISAKGVFLSTD